MPNFAGNQSSASGSTLVRPHLLSSSPSESSEESSESDDRGVTGLGVRGVASQSLPSVRQLSGAATGVFCSGDFCCKGGTGGGLTVFVGVGTGAFAGLGLDGGFVGLASEVGVTGASGAGGLDTAQPILVGQPASVSERCLPACLSQGNLRGVARLCCGEHAVRTPRAIQKRATNQMLVSYVPLAHAGLID